MKTTLLTTSLALLLLGVTAYYYEDGDINTVGMYFMVYTLPIFILVILNNLFLLLFPSSRKGGVKSMIISLIPSVLLIGIGSLFDLKTGYLDGSLPLLFILTGIATIITNFSWSYRHR